MKTTRSFTYDPSADNLTGTLTPAVGSTSVKSYEFVVRNHPSLFHVNFMKHDQYGRAVAGAEFTVYEGTDTGCTTPLTTGTSNAGGVVSIDMSAQTLRAGKYICKETAAPSGILFDPAVAPLYYFTLDAHGNLDGLYLDAAYTAPKISSIINQSTVPPATPQNTPGAPGTPDTPDTPADHTTTTNDPGTPKIVVGYSQEALTAWAAAQASMHTKKLPKTGGFVGSAILFIVGAGMAGGGIYLSRSGKRRRRKHECEDDEMQSV